MLLVISGSGYFDLGFDSYFSRVKCRTTCTEKILYCSFEDPKAIVGNDSNLLIVFYDEIIPDDFVMQLHRF
ncbi:hypothetical protein C7R95_24350 [Enterobacter hormaechei]|nr:hypothetical protein C7R95_24350 [Enterobacter hormaechei]